jgi:hypothetical protein
LSNSVTPSFISSEELMRRICLRPVSVTVAQPMMTQASKTAPMGVVKFFMAGAV